MLLTHKSEVMNWAAKKWGVLPTIQRITLSNFWLTMKLLKS